MFVKTALVAGAAFAIAACAPLPSPKSPSDDFFAKTPKEYRPFVEGCKPWDDWDKAAPPFKVHGNTYHVGTCGISAILIAGDEGHILIDGGTEAGGAIIAKNIKSLGFDLADVKYILFSHEHFDHVAGIAQLQQKTGAWVISSPIAKPVLESGIVAASDPQSGMHDAFPAAEVYQTISDGGTIQLGSLKARVIFTPGHSPGAMSWQWESCDADECKTIVYADSLSPVSSESYRFSDRPDYLAAYFAGLEKLGRVDCDILLTPHPSHSRMLKRMRTDEMVQSGACAYYAIGKAQDIEKRLKREAGENE